MSKRDAGQANRPNRALTTHWPVARVGVERDSKLQCGAKPSHQLQMSACRTNTNGLVSSGEGGTASAFEQTRLMAGRRLGATNTGTEHCFATIGGNADRLHSFSAIGCPEIWRLTLTLILVAAVTSGTSTPKTATGPVSPCATITSLTDSRY